MSKQYKISSSDLIELERPSLSQTLDSNHNSRMSHINQIRPRPSRDSLTLNLRQNFQLLSRSPSKKEIEEEGSYLFEKFVREEICNEGLTPPPPLFLPVHENISELHDINNCHLSYAGDSELINNRTYTNISEATIQEHLVFPENTTLSSPLGYRNSLWTKTGRELRQLADEFARSKERRRVQQKAKEVDISQISWEQFSAMLYELFSDGEISRERIVTLFFFCTDVIIRALKQHAIDYCQRFMQWSLQFICDRVCTWVQQQGGWGAVLGSYVPKFLMTLGAIAVTFAAVVYIKKNW